MDGQAVEIEQASSVTVDIIDLDFDLDVTLNELERTMSLSMKEVAELIGISKGQTIRYVRSHDIPYKTEINPKTNQPYYTMTLDDVETLSRIRRKEGLYTARDLAPQEFYIIQLIPSMTPNYVLIAMSHSAQAQLDALDYHPEARVAATWRVPPMWGDILWHWIREIGVEEVSSRPGGGIYRCDYDKLIAHMDEMMSHMPEVNSE